jgi:hypothetical protein
MVIPVVPDATVYPLESVVVTVKLLVVAVLLGLCTPVIDTVKAVVPLV